MKIKVTGKKTCSVMNVMDIGHFKSDCPWFIKKRAEIPRM